MKRIVSALLAGAALLLTDVFGAGLPEKLRVLSLDLRNARVENPAAPGSELAQDLRRVLESADVDVICVQGALDWENCERVAQLKAGLQVLTCSAFTNAPQVAILARTGALLAWVEETERASGYALAILQAGTHKLAVLSAQSPGPGGPPVEVATQRLLAEVNKLKKFPQNRPDSFLLTAVAIGKPTLLTDSGFQTVAAEPSTSDSPDFFTLNAGFLTRPRSVNFRGLKPAAVLCDFDTSSSFSSKFAYQTPLLFPGETLAAYQAAQQRSAGSGHKWRWLIWVGCIGTAGLWLILLLRRPRPRTLQVIPTGESATLPVNGDPIRSNLLAWIKTAFVQRLISQRQTLLTNEAEATRRTLAIEQKLTMLQSEIQTRISAYEARIERLEQELTAATLDNRELIRAQIELLKEKVAQAKQEGSLVRN